ncbi:hypothetical protein V8G54_035828 [Vigna mungo]|uniref:Uncharacterized protein n=1 Tax=Vigna mungo TaxID=3915 RepID=A0AAQ3MHC1_VIGMU
MLPYASVSEVEVALGRNLPFAETLWFNYSVTKSDYFLYCNNILFLFLIFSLVPLPLVFLELKRLSFFDSYKIQPKVRLSLDEMFRCYKDVMCMFFLVVGPLQLVSYPSIKDWVAIAIGMGDPGSAAGLLSGGGLHQLLDPQVSAQRLGLREDSLRSP